MYKQKLTDVPDHILERPNTIRNGMKWSCDYNVAAWIRYKQLTQDAVKLVLHWVDERGEQTLCVDQATITSPSLLLSGIARLRVQGALESVSLTLETNNLSFSVDELFVQPAKPSAHAKRA